MKVLERAVFELIKDLVDNDKVYSMRAPQKVVAPFIVFQRTDSSRFKALNQVPELAQAYIQIDCYAKDYYSAKNLGLSVEDTLEGYMGEVAYGSDSPQASINIAGISLQNDVDIMDDTAEPFLYRSSASYLITYYR